MPFIKCRSFKATFTGTLSISPGTMREVQIHFIPEFEGRFEATLQLIFKSQNLGQFTVSRTLQAIAGSSEDHEIFGFESLKQEGYIPRSGSGQQVPSENVISLPSHIRPFRYLPGYELPPLVQKAVDDATLTHPYNKTAPRLITALKPRELAMYTYSEYFKALLNVEEGQQQYVCSLSR